MVQLIVTVVTRPGRAGDYVAAFKALAPKVREEEGCIEYDIFQDSNDPRFDNKVRPDTVVLCEKWTNIDALQKHTRGSAALDEFRKQVRDIKQESSYVLLTLA